MAAVALHVADLHKQVTQQQFELRAVERQRRVEAALASQMPRLQRWQSTQVSLCILLDMRPEAWQQQLSCLPVASCSTCLHHDLSSCEEISRIVLTIKHGLGGLLLACGMHHFRCLHSMMACISSASSGCCMQADQQKSTSAVQSALSHALQHVPLLNGATTGAAEQVLLFCSL